MLMRGIKIYYSHIQETDLFNVIATLCMQSFKIISKPINLSCSLLQCDLLQQSPASLMSILLCIIGPLRLGISKYILKIVRKVK